MAAELLAIWGFFLITTCACFLIGLNFAGYFRLEMHEKLAISCGIGFSIIFLLELLIQINYFLGAGVFIGLLAHSVWRFTRKSTGFKFEKEEQTLIFFFFTIVIIQFSILIFSSFVGFDWTLHAYNYVQSIIGGNVFPDRNRTAAFSFSIAFFLQLYQLPVTDLWMAQILSVYWSTCFLFPTFSIAMKLFNKKVAWGTVFLMGLSPFFLMESYTLWSKSLAVYCILLSFYFLFCKKDNRLSGFFALLAFLLHTSFIIYFGIQLIILLIKKQLFQKQYLVHYLIVIGGCGIYLIANSIFATGSGTPFAMLAYPFAINGPDGLLAGTETLDQVFQNFLNSSFLSVAFWRLVSLFFMITPAWAGLTLYRVFIPDTTLPIMTPIESLAEYYRTSLFGAIGTIVGLILIPLLLDWLTKKHKIKSEVYLAVILPFIIIVLYIGWKNYGLWAQGNQGAYPFLAMVVMNYLLQKPWKRRWKILPFAGIALECVVVLLVNFPYSNVYAIANSQTLNSVNIYAINIGWNIIWLITGFGIIFSSFLISQRKGWILNPIKDLFQNDVDIINRGNISPNNIQLK